MHQIYFVKTLCLHHKGITEKTPGYAFTSFSHPETEIFKPCHIFSMGFGFAFGKIMRLDKITLGN